MYMNCDCEINKSVFEKNEIKALLEESNSHREFSKSFHPFMSTFNT